MFWGVLRFVPKKNLVLNLLFWIVKEEMFDLGIVVIVGVLNWFYRL